MSAARKAIRHKIVELLKAEPQLAFGDRVFANRATPLDEGDLPAVLVYTLEESAEIFDEPRRYRRTCQVAVEIAARQAVGDTPPALDDELDDLCEAIEARLCADERLDGTAIDSRLAGTEFEYEGEGRRVIAAARMKFEVDFFSEAPEDKSGDLDPLERAGVDYDLAQQDGALEASDVVEVPQA